MSVYARQVVCRARNETRRTGAGKGKVIMAANAVCPECDAEIEVAGVEVGEIVPCGECGADLEVVSVEPVTLALAPEEGEDWGE